MKKTYFITVIFVLLASISAYSTTWSEKEIQDPISGETTKVYDIMSYGGYIYNWPSKYDAVFWPLTDTKFIRFNTKSGYIAFGSDFEEINDAEKKQVTEFLKQNYDPANPPVSHIDMLKWLFKVYEVRGADNEFKIRHYCLMSYLTRKNTSESSNYRKKALSLMDKYLNSAKPSMYKAQLYIVAGFYSALLKIGNEEIYWDKLTNSEYGIDDPEKLKSSKEYIDKILKEIKSGEYKENYFK